MIEEAGTRDVTQKAAAVEALGEEGSLQHRHDGGATSCEFLQNRQHIHFS